MIQEALQAVPIDGAGQPEGINLAQLNGLLQPAVKGDLSALVRGMILEGLDIPRPNVRYGDLLYFEVAQTLPGYQRKPANYSASVILPVQVYEALPDKTIIAAGRKIDIRISALQLGKRSNLVITVDQVRENGVSEYELKNREIKAECTKLGWFQRERRRAPAFFTRVGLITSSSGGVASDIVEILRAHGLPESAIQVKHCGSAAEMASTFMAMDASGEFDAICFFRGGNEDPSMAIFRDMDLFRAIVGARTFTATGLNHQADHPVIESIVDLPCNTPTAFGKMVEATNNEVMEQVRRLATGSTDSFGVALAKVQKELAGEKRLADSYFATAAKAVQGSLHTLPSEAFAGVVRSLGAEATAGHGAASVALQQVVAGMAGELGALEGVSGRSYIAAVGGVDREVAGQSRACSAAFTRIDQSIRAADLAQAQFKNRALYVLLAGIVASGLAGWLSLSVALALVVGLLVLAAGASLFLRKQN
jgi:hypothetical protein